MADAVGSAVAQEAVSRIVSSVLSNREAAASKRHNMERLQMARNELKFALEISKKLPIMDVSLLQRRRTFKRAYEECGDALQRCKLRVLEDEKVEQGVTHSSTLRKSIHYIKSFISSSVSLKKDELTCSDVGRFEWFADKASKFVRDVETGCSLAHYRFFSPLIRPLLEGKNRWYKQVRGSQTNDLLILPVWSEERVVEACIVFNSKDRMTPTKTIRLGFLLRLSESTDVIGTAINCLQLLEPVFKPFAEVAMGELAQLPTQIPSGVNTLSCLPDTSVSAIVTSATILRPDRCSCRSDWHEPCANNPVTSKLPAQVAFMCFGCYIPAFEYNLRDSADGAGGNILELFAAIAPHRLCYGLQESSVNERIVGREEHSRELLDERNILENCLRQMKNMQMNNAFDVFIHRNRWSR